MKDYKLIQSSPFFNRTLYREWYSDFLGSDEDEIDHYLRIGASLGFKPSEEFEPCAYKLSNPEVTKKYNPLVHFLQSGTCIKDAIPYALADYFPDIKFGKVPRKKINEMPLSQYDYLNPKEARVFSKESTCELNLKDRLYNLYSPSSKYIIEKIRNNKSIKIIRWTHGVFDMMLAFSKVCIAIKDQSKTSFNDNEIINAASRLCLQKYKQKMDHWQIFTENYMLELYKDIGSINRHPDITHAVAFKGYPSKDNRPLMQPGATAESDENSHGTLNIFSKYFDSRQIWFDATYFKRGVISGGFKKLGNVCKNHPVVFLGPKWFSCLEKRWNLNQFVHIPVHWEGAFIIRNELLQRCREELIAVIQSNRNIPVFIFQCGSVASWLILRLAPQFPSCIFIDIGQAINAWVLDEAFNSDMYAWSRTYRKAMVENLGLKKLYKSLCGRHYNYWIECKNSF